MQHPRLIVASLRSRLSPLTATYTRSRANRPNEMDYVLDASGERPKGPYAKAVAEWERLGRFIESRLRRE